jgi:hypothetical protein
MQCNLAPCTATSQPRNDDKGSVVAGVVPREKRWPKAGIAFWLALLERMDDFNLDRNVVVLKAGFAQRNPT